MSNSIRVSSNFNPNPTIPISGIGGYGPIGGLYGPIGPGPPEQTPHITGCIRIGGLGHRRRQPRRRRRISLPYPHRRKPPRRRTSPPPQWPRTGYGRAGRGRSGLGSTSALRVSPPPPPPPPLPLFAAAAAAANESPLLVILQGSRSRRRCCSTTTRRGRLASSPSCESPIPIHPQITGGVWLLLGRRVATVFVRLLRLDVTRLWDWGHREIVVSIREYLGGNCLVYFVGVLCNFSIVRFLPTVAAE